MEYVKILRVVVFVWQASVIFSCKYVTIFKINMHYIYNQKKYKF